MKPLKRIAIFMPSLFGGGGQRSMLNLAHGMVDCGYSVDLVLAQLDGAFVNDVREEVRVVDLKASRAITSLPSLMKYLRREQPEVMLSVFGYVNIIALWARRLAGVRTKLFVNEQNTVSLEAGNASNWRGRITPWLMKHFYPWSDGVIVVSEGVREDLIKVANIPDQQIKVIYNASIVGEEVLRRARAPVDHPWFQPGQPPVIVAVGRLQIQKDFPTLIRAFAIVRKSVPARLMILGEGRDRPPLEALIAKLGLEEDVAMPGFVSNPYAYMARASMFVLSSRWEGLPTVLIEALCVGTYVVSTDCPSGPREILKGGKYGDLVPVGDVDSLSNALKAALRTKRARPPIESWQPYDVMSVVDQYLAELITS